jgi:hypothetical protein
MEQAVAEMEQLKQQYQKINKAIDALTELIEKKRYKTQEEYSRYSQMLEQQKYAREQIEMFLIPKDLHHERIVDRILNVALGNALMLVILRSETIIDMICEMEEAGIKAPDTVFPLKALIENFGKEKINQFLNKAGDYKKYLIYAINNDPQLHMDYEWVMGKFGYHDLEFETCCQCLGLNPNRIRDVIRYASKLPMKELIQAYESYMAVANQTDTTGISDVMKTVPQEDD